MKVPYTNFKTREGDTDEVGGCTFIGGSWKDVDTTDIFDNKKVVVFALPGAFTPTCSSQQVPGYEAKYDELKALGWELICCDINNIETISDILPAECVILNLAAESHVDKSFDNVNHLSHIEENLPVHINLSSNYPLTTEFTEAIQFCKKTTSHLQKKIIDISAIIELFKYFNIEVFIDLSIKHK